jgi:hypothetical protein
MCEIKKLIEREKRERECTENLINLLQSDKLFCERRSSELADEFTRLEVQIATILIAFAGVFLSIFKNIIKDISSTTFLLLIKFTYAGTLFFLIISLALGLLHLKRKEKWWDETLHKKAILLQNWKNNFTEKTNFKTADSFHEGAISGKGIITFSPRWTWLIQTVCLGIAFILFFILFLVFLFIN